MEEHQESLGSNLQIHHALEHQIHPSHLVHHISENQERDLETLVENLVNQVHQETLAHDHLGDEKESLDQDEKDESKEDSGKMEEDLKEDKKERLCAAKDCENKCRKRGRLCDKHQKQRSRGKKFDLKEDCNLDLKGRPPVPFSKSHNKSHKLKAFDDLIVKYAGGREEMKELMSAYLSSPHYNQQNTKDASKARETKLKISDNIISLIKKLPPISPYRRPLIDAIATGIEPQTLLSDVLDISTRTIRKAKDEHAAKLFDLAYPQGTKRKRYTDEDLRAMQDWVRIECAPPEGSTRVVKKKRGSNEVVPLHPQKDNDAELYRKYVDAFSSQNKRVLSYKVFQREKPREVKRV